MLKINRYNLLRWLSIIVIFIAAGLAVFVLIRYSRIRAGFPSGTKIAGVPVGGMDQNAAAQRLNQVFNTPIELKYGDARIQVKPSTLGFSIDTVGMIAAADQQRVSLPFWSGFWDFLWNRVPSSMDTPIRSSLEEKRLQVFLIDEIAARYDKVPESSIGVPGTVSFQLGTPGEVLNIEQAIPVVEKTLQNPFQRSVELPIDLIEPPRPSIANLEIQLKQILDQSGFDGLTEMYLLDLKSREELHFAYENGIDYRPGIAFTAASTVKIPIMVSVFRRLSEPTPARALDLMRSMISESNNPPADALMNEFIANNIGPNFVTSDLQELGFSNTFLAGMFYLGAPLLNRYPTPANSRLDYTTDPDTYNQTTTNELGSLLDDIYQCAETGGGSFNIVFPGELSQSECQLMIDYLLTNKIGQLLQAGLPDGVKMAHKHGWIVETDGVIHTIIDAGIVYTSHGNYVIVAAMYQPTQLIYDIANLLQARLSTAIYNYFNIK